MGQITNYSTSMLAMLPMFESEKTKEQYEEIRKRLKTLRKLQGEEIDRIKGTTPPNFPRSWRYWVQIDKDDSDIEKAEKYKYNSMVVRKKPYFFIYLYSNLMKEYKAYEKGFNSISMKHFGVKMKELLIKENKTEKELSLIRKYRKYSPVLETPCIMNILCKDVENTEFDIKYRKNAKSLLYQFSNQIEFDEEKIKQLTNIYREYKSKKKYNSIITLIENEGINDDDMNELIKTISYSHKDDCKRKMYSLFNSSSELFEYLIEICKRYNFDADFIWDVLEDDILNIIPAGNSLIIVDDEKGKDYLGKNYKLKEVGTSDNF